MASDGFMIEPDQLNSRGNEFKSGEDRIDLGLEDEKLLEMINSNESEKSVSTPQENSERLIQAKNSSS